MYCPAKMNQKIAEVKIAVGNEIQRLCDDEKQEEHDKELTGGHLEAQLHRFERLWRVHFFLYLKEWERVGEERISFLRQGIEQLALGHISPSQTPEAVARSIALGLISLKESTSPWKGSALRETGVAALSNDSTARRYPYGAPGIESLLTSSK